jgi:SAM-dependent methyltransferase
MTILVALAFFILLFILAFLWIFVPAVYGLPSRPTKPKRILKALQLANLKPDETLYDLGAGDGRVLLVAAKEFGAQAIGIEIGPVQCALIWLRVVASGLGHKIQIKWGNFFKVDLSHVDVVFIYATSTEVAKLAPYLEKQMKPGSRVVSISADFPDWEPHLVDEDSLVFVYAMPPKAGNWTTYMLKNSK